MEFCGIKNEKMSELLADQKLIQEKVEDYVFSITGKVSPNTIPTKINPRWDLFKNKTVQDLSLRKVKIFDPSYTI